MTDQKDISWLRPLFVNAGGDEICIGINEGGDWYLRKKIPCALDEHSEEAMLLPLMERGYGGTIKEVKEMIKLRLLECGIEVQVAETFPYSVPVKTALKYKMGYWLGMTAAWIGDIGMNLELAEIIVEILDEKWIDQKYRHILKKQLHKWEKENGYSLLRR